MCIFCMCARKEYAKHFGKHRSVSCEQHAKIITASHLSLTVTEIKEDVSIQLERGLNMVTPVTETERGVDSIDVERGDKRSVDE